MMRLLYSLGYGLLMAAVCCSNASGQSVWKLRREEEGIKVYTASSDTSAFQTLKAEFDVMATTSQLMQVLMDAPAQPRWVYNAKSARVLTHVSTEEVVLYSVVGLPWPCSNRDYVARIKVAHPAAGITTIDSHAEDGHMAPQKGIIRVRESSAHWQITESVPGHLTVQYQLRFNPGGALPAWLVNMFITRGPCHTFRHLREEVAQRVVKIEG